MSHVSCWIAWKIFIQHGHFVEKYLGQYTWTQYPSLPFFKSVLKSIFSPVLSHCAYLTWIPHLVLKLLIEPNIRFFHSVLSSRTNIQCFSPPKVGVEGELMSNNSLSPKILEWSTALLLTPPFLSSPECNFQRGWTDLWDKDPWLYQWLMWSLSKGGLIQHVRINIFLIVELANLALFGLV